LTHVAIEAVLMTPLLVLQILLLPFVASTMSSYWANATRDITLQETASQIASMVQQLYLSLNRIEVTAGTITQASTFPTQIAGHTYTARGSLRTSLPPDSGKILTINVTLQDLGNTVTAQTSLGPNVFWNENSVFYSSSLTASIKVQKSQDGTLSFSFG
jgi:hypothetical protein